MKLEITRDVIHDLWPLCQSGDASADSRAIVEAYLVSDAELASQLKEIDEMNTSMPNVTLSPDAEKRLLMEARFRAWTRVLGVGGALALGFFAVVMMALVFSGKF